MTRSLVPLIAGLALLFTPNQACAESDTEPFHYTQGFEDEPDPVRFWTSYKKKYTVNFKGTTDEKARSGRRSFKLDVTFDEASRFLWQIPLPRKVPAAGKLRFSGHMLLGEETTAKATLGVSFALPPTHHAGCTAWGTLLQSTDGQWKVFEDELVKRGREKADLIVGLNNWSAQGENVGPVVEKIIIDVRAEAGQRVVLYVDDLELKGNVPSDEEYGKETERRWAIHKLVVEVTIHDWEAVLDDAEKSLSALADLSPRAGEMRKSIASELQEVKAKVAAAKAMGEIRKKDQQEIASFLAEMATAPINLQALSRAEREGRHALIYVTPPISDRMILPDQRSLPGTPSQKITLTAARGEYEPASFVVSALQDIRALSVKISDLLKTGTGSEQEELKPETNMSSRGACPPFQQAACDLRSNRATIPASQVDVKTVKCWYQAGTAWVSNRQDKSLRILSPELLLNDDTLIKLDEEKKENYVKLTFPEGEEYAWVSDPTDVSSRSMPVDKFPVKDSPVLLPVDIGTGTNKQFWLTLHVPGDTAPGTYEGTITLSTRQQTIDELTLTVNVLPFELLPPYYTSSIDYHGRLDPSGKGTIGSWLKSRRQFRAELKNMVAHGLRNCQHYSIPKTMLGEVLKIREEVGMDNRTLYLKSTIPIGNPTDREALEAIKRNVRDILEFTKEYGTETVYFYGMDERRGEELRSQRPAWTAVREAGGKVFVAGWGDNIEMMSDVQDMHVRAGSPNAEEVARWHALGHKIFCYSNPQTGVENPVVYRRNFGLVLWKHGYDGAATNAYQHTFGATWNDFDHRVFRSHTIAYPTVDGVIDTIAWEGYREGVDDVRYVTTLERAVAKARESEDRTLVQKADAAEKFLQYLKSGNLIEVRNLDVVREEIVEQILKLSSAAQR